MDPYLSGYQKKNVGSKSDQYDIYHTVKLVYTNMELKQLCLIHLSAWQGVHYFHSVKHQREGKLPDLGARSLCMCLLHCCHHLSPPPFTTFPPGAFRFMLWGWGGGNESRRWQRLVYSVLYHGSSCYCQKLVLPLRHPPTHVFMNSTGDSL